MTLPGFEGLETVTVGGATLAYREVGTGDPVVFVHGTLSDLRTWEQQLPAIAESYRAVSYSRRYARPNPDIDPGTDDQMLPHVDDLVTFLEAIDAAPAHLIGNSWGAFISLLTALRHPGSVRTLVLEEPPVIPLVLGPGTRPDPRILLRNLVRRPRATLAVLRFGAGTVAPAQKAFRRGEDERAMEIFVHGVLGKAAYERLPDQRKQQALENLRAAKAQLLGAGFPQLSEDDLRSVAAPTLLLTGEHSSAALHRLTDILEENLDIVERIEIRGASHAMHEEAADAVNAAILDFLARRGGSAANSASAHEERR